ncbi:MAG: TIGR01458 family HAD-type hydrolase [Novosphingobium sp.]
MALRLALLDLGGVVYVGDSPLPGAVAAVRRLRDAGLAVRFLTNTTRKPHAAVLADLRVMGLDVAADELFTPSLAARQVITAHGYSPRLLVHPALRDDFDGLPEGGRRAVVVGDAGEYFTYDAMNAAFRELDNGAALLALANNRSFRDADGALSLDAGPFVAALTFASGVEPVVLGKPSGDFFGAALDSAGCAADEAFMVGDDVENDIGGALAAGLSGVLVRTGKYRPGDERTIAPSPTAVVDDLAAAVNWALGG